MKLVYTPEGAERREWEFDPNRILNVEAEAIERATGLTWTEVLQATGRGSVGAIHAILWVLLKRSTPTLGYDDVVFGMHEVDFQVDDADAQNIVDTLTAKRGRGEALSPEETRVYDALIAQGVKPTPPADDPKG